MDSSWRPTNWASVKYNIAEQTPVVFSPSTGYAKGHTDEIMEKVATAVIEAILKEQPNVKLGWVSGIGTDAKP